MDIEHKYHMSRSTLNIIRLIIPICNTTEGHLLHITNQCNLFILKIQVSFRSTTPLITSDFSTAFQLRFLLLIDLGFPVRPPMQPYPSMPNQPQPVRGTPMYPGQYSTPCT